MDATGWDRTGRDRMGWDGAGWEQMDETGWDKMDALGWDQIDWTSRDGRERIRKDPWRGGCCAWTSPRAPGRIKGVG